MENKKSKPSLIDLVEKLLNEAKKKKEKKASKEKMADKDYDGDGEVETSKEEYFGSKDKAIKKAMGKKEIVSKKKKKQLKEGREIGGGQITYGGFPRILKEGEESESLSKSSGSIRGELEKHMSVINKHGEMLHKTNHPHREKFGKMWSEFSQGKFDHANELIEMGADPSAVGNYIKIKTSPEYKAHMAKVQSEITPESMGYGRPGSGSNETFD